MRFNHLPSVAFLLPAQAVHVAGLGLVAVFIDRREPVLPRFDEDAPSRDGPRIRTP